MVTGLKEKSGPDPGCGDSQSAHLGVAHYCVEKKDKKDNHPCT